MSELTPEERLAEALSGNLATGVTTTHVGGKTDVESRTSVEAEADEFKTATDAQLPDTGAGDRDDAEAEVIHVDAD
jgi:hypothetical protein